MQITLNAISVSAFICPSNQSHVSNRVRSTICYPGVSHVYIIMIICQVNNYIVRSYRDVIVVANIVTRGTSKA